VEEEEDDEFKVETGFDDDDDADDELARFVGWAMEEEGRRVPREKSKSVEGSLGRVTGGSAIKWKTKKK